MGDKPETDNSELPDSEESVARQAEHMVAEDMARYMSQFARSFEVSAHRWELIVYPFLLAFIILAGYGFFLIYNLTTDIHRITGQMEVISENMVQITSTISTMSDSTLAVNENMKIITVVMDHQNSEMLAIVANLEQMNNSIDSMSHTMYRMGYDTRSMGRDFRQSTGPVRFMNSFLPW